MRHSQYIVTNKRGLDMTAKPKLNKVTQNDLNNDSKSEKEDKNFKFTGTAFWASVTKPNDQSGQYQVDISIDDDTADMLSSLGITIKSEEEQEDSKGNIGKHVGTENDRGRFVTCKRSLQFKSKDGMVTSLPPPKILDSKLKELPKDTLIGNGSRVNVVANVYHWKFRGTKGVSLGFSALQVLDLVPYSRNSGLDLLTEEEGYIADKDISLLESENDFNDSDSESLI